MVRAFRKAWSPIARIWLFGVPFGLILTGIGIAAAAYFAVAYLTGDGAHKAWIVFGFTLVACTVVVVSAWVTQYRRAGGHLKGDAKRIAFGIGQLLRDYPDRAAISPEDENQESDYMIRMRGEYAKRFAAKLQNLQRECAIHQWDKNSLWAYGYWLNPQNRHDIQSVQNLLEGISRNLP